MGRYLRGNEQSENSSSKQVESIFAQEVLRHVGGSCVYIAKRTKLIEIEEKEEE